MGNIKIIIKNFFSLAGGEFAAKGIAFITTIYLARIILPEGFGIIGYATAFVSYFLLFVNFGFDVISIKHIANDKTVISKYVNNIITFRILIASISYILLLMIIYFLNESVTIKLAIALIGLNLFIQSFSTEFVFLATEKIKYLTIKVVLTNLLILILVLIFVKDIKDVLFVVGISVFVNLVTSIALYLKYKMMFSPFRWQFQNTFYKILLYESFPLFISAFMATIYYNIDIVFLGILKTEKIVGLYNVSYKIFLLGILPFSILLRVFLPSLSKINDIVYIKKTVEIFTGAMIIMGIGIMSIIFFNAKEMVLFIFGNAYLSSIIPLKILALNGMVVAVNIAFGNPLTVWGKQKEHAIILSFGAITNIILNFLLIPKYSLLGAAMATLFSECVVFIGVLYYFSNTLNKILNEGKSD